MINWEVRLKNVNFWIAVVPAFALLVQALRAIFGVDLDFSNVVEKVLTFVNVLFAFLALLGVVTDPTTKGLGDSRRAMTYTEPN